MHFGLKSMIEIFTFLLESKPHSYIFLYKTSFNEYIFFRINYGPSSCLVWRGPQRRLVETILTAELTYSSWSVRERYHLLKTILQDDTYNKGDPHFWSWICVWFCFFTPKYQTCSYFMKNYLSTMMDNLIEFSQLRHSSTGTPLKLAPLVFQRGVALQ